MKKINKDAICLFENTLVNYSKSANIKEYSAKEFQQMQNYIKNLEKTIMINKEIIDQLCSQKSKNEAQNKIEEEKVNVLLNENQRELKEKDNLQNELLEYKKQIENMKNEKELLINKIQKITLEYNQKENEIINEHKKKTSHLEEIIEKLSNDLKEKGNKSCYKNPILKLNQNDKVQLENESLTNMKNSEKNTNSNVLMTLEKVSTKKSIPFIPTLDLSKVIEFEGVNFSQHIHKLEESIRILSSKIKHLEENNKLLAEKNLKLHNSNESLRKINENLNLSLSLNKSHIKKSFVRRPIDHSKYSNSNIDIAFLKSTKLSESLILNRFPISSKEGKLNSEFTQNFNSNGKKILHRNDKKKLILSESKSLFNPQNGQIETNNSIDNKNFNFSLEKSNIKLEN